MLFLYLISRASSGISCAKSSLSQLISKYHFSPMMLPRSQLSEAIFSICKIDPSLIQHLRDIGFDSSVYNDNVMNLLLTFPLFNNHHIELFLKAGFKLSDVVIKRGLVCGRRSIVQAFDARIEQGKLSELAHDAIFEYFGPYSDLAASLNVAWKPTTANYLIETFKFDRQHIAKCILADPKSFCTISEPYMQFPVTRAYLTASPYAIWRWILDTFPIDDEFCQAAFEDAICRAIGDSELHSLHIAYLNAGFILRPRHIRILASRVLHRHMTANALDILKRCQIQVSDRLRDGTIPVMERVTFRIALHQVYML